ncbi:hypothetical protein VSH64_36040 [Amycolatopsis rhabdoformis]|uniref:DUF2742 domain-containing protein n=1 Tax=Amycolatopsis rhabdoformis TaxID=1448059 RepID=A0ABZ1I1D2_9PSEU|nr:hypothetical protein [Amycolatopsis rhabdoformis]WSE28212.1 hypothetical protein VSH64_36040 [Amycolatopsis rhabdoformis]
MRTIGQRRIGPVQITVDQWHLINWALEHEVHTRIDDGAWPRAVQAAQSIRDAGSAWTRSFDDSRKDSLGWPPRDEIMTLTLEPRQWALMLSVLRALNESQEDNALRDLADLVSGQLPGLKWP